MEKIYEAEVTTLAGRNGHSKSSDGVLDLDIRLPKEMGGDSSATNPEQLFAAAWSACFGTSLTIAAEIHKVKIGNVSVTAKISVLHDSGSYDLGAHLLINIEEIEYETSKQLVETAKSICSYSKATKGNINAIYEVVSNLG
jgi:Ohr subfamily peroxiredoxin